MDSVNWISGCDQRFLVLCVRVDREVQYTPSGFYLTVREARFDIDPLDLYVFWWWFTRCPYCYSIVPQQKRAGLPQHSRTDHAGDPYRSASAFHYLSGQNLRGVISPLYLLDPFADGAGEPHSLADEAVVRLDRGVFDGGAGFLEFFREGAEHLVGRCDGVHCRFHEKNIVFGQFLVLIQDTQFLLVDQCIFENIAGRGHLQALAFGFNHEEQIFFHSIAKSGADVVGRQCRDALDERQFFCRIQHSLATHAVTDEEDVFRVDVILLGDGGIVGPLGDGGQVVFEVGEEIVAFAAPGASVVHVDDDAAHAHQGKLEVVVGRVSREAMGHDDRGIGARDALVGSEQVAVDVAAAADDIQFEYLGDGFLLVDLKFNKCIRGFHVGTPSGCFFMHSCYHGRRRLKNTGFLLFVISGSYHEGVYYFLVTAEVLVLTRMV